jgi:hypothetical protein
MRALRRVLLAISVGVCLCALAAYGQDQDSPSLGDAARQARLQKQQKEAQAKDGKPTTAPATDSQSKDGEQAAAGKNEDGKDAAGKTATAPKTPHVITNDEIPEHASTGQPSGYRNPSPSYSTLSSADSEGAAAQWKQTILSQKNAVASMQSQINSLNDSIKFAPANCVSGCVQWNERQKQKQDQVESMKSQLEEMQKRLEDMQAACRQQGFGSSVYDP